MDTPEGSDDEDYDEDANDGSVSSYPRNFISAGSGPVSQGFGLSYGQSQVGGYTQSQMPIQMDDASIMNDSYSQSMDSQMMYDTGGVSSMANPYHHGSPESSYYQSPPGGDISMMGSPSEMYSHHSSSMMEESKPLSMMHPIHDSSSGMDPSKMDIDNADKFIVMFMGLTKKYAVYAWEETEFRDIRTQLEQTHSKTLSDTDHRFELIYVEPSAPNQIKTREPIADITNVKTFLEKYPELLLSADDDEADHTQDEDSHTEELPIGYSIMIELNTFDIEIVDGRTPSKVPLIIKMVVLESWTLKELLQKLNVGVTDVLAAESSGDGTSGDGVVGSSSLRGGQFTSLCLPNGTEMEPEVSLTGYDITYEKAMERKNNHQHVFRLIHELEIEITDIECEIDVEVRVKPSNTISEMIANYLQIAKREEHTKWSLTTSDSSNNSGHTSHSLRDLSDHPGETVGEVGIQNGDTLDYSVNQYEIEIFDSMAVTSKKRRGGSDRQTEPERLMVYDHWTLAEVRTEYSQQSGQPVMESEKFLSDERQLEEGVKLCRLRIREGEQLLIERMADDIAVDYICGDCGATVSLKAMDEVKCRACFHPIVFKKRTGRVCQFNCR